MTLSEDKAGQDRDVLGSNREQTDSVNNIFDTVFRTIVEYLPWLAIPLINEAFFTFYSKDEPMRVLKNEHVTHGGKIITDLLFEIGVRLNHVELQSAVDGRMIIRIMEYAAAIAIENAEKDGDGAYRMRFPASCVIYLRSTKNTPDSLTMRMEFPGGETVAFEAPVLKLQEYTKDAIFQKKLLLLLPYYLMRYERELKEIGELEPERQAEADERMEAFLEEYRDICDRLFADCEEAGDYYLYITLVEQIQAIAEYLAPKNEKGRVEAMGGTVVKPLAQIMLEQGIERGMERGMAYTLISLVRRKFMRGRTPEEIAEDLEEDIEKIDRICGIMEKYAPEYDVEKIVGELCPLSE